jgi:hypothetical protein
MMMSTVRIFATKQWLKGALSALCLVLAGCATGPKVNAVYEQGVNFTNYKTFAFLADLKPSGEQAYRTLADKYLEEAIRKELTDRGLVEQEGGDLLVGFQVSSKEKIVSTVTPGFDFGYYGYRGRRGFGYGYGYGSETIVSQYTEGTLSIDVVDAAQKQLVWQGVAIGKLKAPKENQLRQEIFQVVNQIFIKYPIPGPVVITP